MKKSRIILLSVLLVLVAAGTAAVLYADKIAGRIASEQVKRIAAEQQIPLDWADLQVRLLHGSVRVDSLSTEVLLPDSTTGDSLRVSLTIPRLDIGRIHWFTLLRRRVARIDRVRLTDSRIALVQRKGQMQLRVDSLSLAVHDLAFNLSDSTFAYNDSVYDIRCGRVAFTSPDGLFSAVIGGFATHDAGAVVLTDLSGGNTDKREEHAVKMGRQEVTWARFRLSEVRTSPVNIIRTALTRELRLESIAIKGQRTDIYYDSHFPPKEPYPMPGESLMALPVPLHIGHLDARLNLLHLEVTSDGEHVGKLDLKRVHARISDMDNTPGKTMRTVLDTYFADGGKIHIETDMTMNQRGTMTFLADITNTTGANLKDLTKPLMGVELTCNIRSIQTQCTGDKDTLRGHFCMRHDSLSVHVEKDSPVKPLKTFSGLVNLLAPVVLVTANPANPQEEPKSYEVTAVHDPMQPFPAYFIGVIGDGMAQTVLPFGLGKGIMKK